MSHAWLVLHSRHHRPPPVGYNTRQLAQQHQERSQEQNGEFQQAALKIMSKPRIAAPQPSVGRVTPNRASRSSRETDGLGEVVESNSSSDTEEDELLLLSGPGSSTNAGNTRKSEARGASKDASNGVVSPGSFVVDESKYPASPQDSLKASDSTHASPQKSDTVFNVPQGSVLFSPAGSSSSWNSTSGHADSRSPIEVNKPRACYAFFEPPFLREACLESEAFIAQPAGLKQALQEREAARWMSMDASRYRRIVYDSIEPPPSQRGVPGPGAWVNTETGQPFEWYVPKDAQDQTLVFESRFESGNLKRAIQVGDFEYDLQVRTDVNTNGHTQWYFFRVSNIVVGETYKFNLFNMYKSDSLYNHGLRPLMYSEHLARTTGIGWRRAGERVAYFSNPSVAADRAGMYTLSFEVTFDHAKDTVYFAHCFPYTWTDLQRYLLAMESNPLSASIAQRSKLCDSLAGNRIDLLTITNFNSSPERIRRRKGVVLTSRVHPGESNASWMMKGSLDYLLSDHPTARELRDKFVFKVVPMINVDGVINGCYRCALSGCDLNRHWKTPHPLRHRPVHFLRQLIGDFKAERPVVLFVDMHGHSGKKNIFMYGCDNGTGPLRLQERVFPMIMSHVAGVFSFSGCNFKMQKEKESTGRVVVRKEFDIVNSYTMEASFAGADFGKYENLHFSTHHYQAVGRRLLDSLSAFCNTDGSASREAMRRLEELFPLPDPLSLLEVAETTSATSVSKTRKKKSKQQSAGGSRLNAKFDVDSLREDLKKLRTGRGTRSTLSGSGGTLGASGTNRVLSVAAGSAGGLSNAGRARSMKRKPAAFK